MGVKERLSFVVSIPTKVVIAAVGVIALIGVAVVLTVAASVNALLPLSGAVRT